MIQYVFFAIPVFLLRRKLGINQMKSNKTDSVTKQCYVTYSLRQARNRLSDRMEVFFPIPD